MANRYCYPCIVERSALSGRASIGEGDGYGTCSSCEAPHRRLYKQRTLDALPGAATTPLPEIRRQVRRGQDHGIAIVLMAVALAVAAMCLALCSRAETSKLRAPSSEPAPASGGEKAPASPQGGARSRAGSEAQSSELFLAWCQLAIRRLPVYHDDVMPGGGISEGKDAQLTAIARAVSTQVSSLKPPSGFTKRGWAALLLTIGYHESGFSLRIHAGLCKPQECDRGKARGPWQLHKNADNAPVWGLMFGQENTTLQVGAADHLLRRNLVTCSQAPAPVRVPSVLTAYAGRRCFVDWPGLNARLSTYERLVAK
jgi:hypothetical protein